MRHHEKLKLIYVKTLLKYMRNRISRKYSQNTSDKGLLFWMHNFFNSIIERLSPITMGNFLSNEYIQSSNWQHLNKFSVPFQNSTVKS